MRDFDLIFRREKKNLFSAALRAALKRAVANDGKARLGASRQAKASGSFGEFLPLSAGKFNQLAANRLELGSTVVVFDFLRVVGNGVN